MVAGSQAGSVRGAGVTGELMRPTAVTAATAACLFHPHQPAVVFARGNLLCVYQLVEQSLVLHATWRVWACVSELRAVRLAGHACEALVLALPDAKMAIVTYDATRDMLSTVSMHYFELLDETTPPPRYRPPPQLSVDPRGRCVVMRFYRDRLGVVPLRGDGDAGLGADDDDAELDLLLAPHLAAERPAAADNVRVSPVAASWDIDLAGCGVHNVKDFVFLAGYYEPTILVLHEPVQTWAGRFARQHNTCQVSALSLNMAARRSPVIWSVDQLPHDAFALLSVAVPIGGALVLTPDAIVYTNQNSVVALSVNSFGDVLDGTVRCDRADTPALRLAGAVATWLEPGHALLSLLDGDLYLLSLLSDGRSVSSISLARAGSSVLARQLVRVTDDLVLFACSRSDTLLVQYRRADPPALRDTAAADDAAAAVAMAMADGDGAAAAAAAASAIPQRPSKRARHGGAQLLGDGDDAARDDADDTAAAADAAAAAADELADYALDDADADLFGLGTTRDRPDDASAEAAVRYVFSVVDTLPSLAPIVAAAAGAVQDVRAADAARTSELMACTGYGKTGALYRLARCLRASSMSLVQLPLAAEAVFTLFRGAGGRRAATDDVLDADDDVDFDEQHVFLLASSSDATTVFRIDEDAALTEVPATQTVEFLRDEPTLAAASLCRRAVNVQVCRTRLRVLVDARSVQDVLLPPGAVVDAATAADPYIAALVRFPHTGATACFLWYLSAVTLRLEDVVESMRQPVAGDAAPVLLRLSMVSASQLTRAADLLAVRGTASVADGGGAGEAAAAAVADGGGSGDAAAAAVEDVVAMDTADIEVDDDDDGGEDREDGADLYGRKVSSQQQQQHQRQHGMRNGLGQEPRRLQEHQQGSSGNASREAVPVLAVVDARASITLYHLPTGDAVWRCADATLADSVLPDQPDADAPPPARPAHLAGASVADMCVVSLGPARATRLHVLLVLSTGETLVYAAIPVPAAAATARTPRLPFALVRQTQALPVMHAGVRRCGDMASSSAPSPTSSSSSLFTAFQRVGNQHRGVFLAGTSPAWLLAPRAHLHWLPVSAADASDGVVAMAPLHVPAMPYACALCLPGGRLGIAQLPGDLRVDSGWAARKLPLRCTPRMLVHQPASHTYAVAVSQSLPLASTDMRVITAFIRDTQLHKKVQNEVAVNAQVEELAVDVLVPPRYPPIYEERFELRLIAGDEYAVTDRAPLQRDEAVLSMAVAEVQTSAQGMVTRLLVGTGFALTEDMPGKGRVLIFQTVVPRGVLSGDQNRAYLKLVHAKDLRSSVSIVAGVHGLVAACTGPKVILYHFFDETELIGVAFHDAQIFLKSQCVMRNFLLLGDAYRSVSLLRWRAQNKTLQLVAKSPDALRARVTDFVVFDGQLLFLAVDAARNLHIHAYDPDAPHTRGGQLLERVADTHLADGVTSSLRVPMPRVAANAKTLQLAPGRHANLLTTTSGALVYFAPLTKPQYRRLERLQLRLVTAIPHVAGLHPLAFRLFRSEDATQTARRGKVLDAQLLRMYRFLPAAVQATLAKSIGAAPRILLAELSQLEMIANVF